MFPDVDVCGGGCSWRVVDLWVAADCSLGWRPLGVVAQSVQKLDEVMVRRQVRAGQVPWDAGVVPEHDFGR